MKNETQYVLSFAYSVERPTSIVLVEKNRPDWQRGRLNLPGGHIEAGETPVEAAARELFEETGIRSHDVASVGEMSGRGWRVFVCACMHHDTARTMTDEQVHVMDCATALSDERLVPNLRLIIPLCLSHVSGWAFTYKDDDRGFHVVI